MAELKRSQVRAIEEAMAYPRGYGYVLDFSDRTMHEFFEDEFGIDIYSEENKANDGGVDRVPKRQEDLFRALDDLMAVVEALCPTWPERRPFERTGDMRL